MLSEGSMSLFRDAASSLLLERDKTLLGVNTRVGDYTVHELFEMLVNDECYLSDEQINQLLPAFEEYEKTFIE